MSSGVILFATVLAAFGAAGIFFLKRAGDTLKQQLAQSGDFSQFLGGLLSNIDLWLGTGLYLLAFIWMMATISRVPLSLYYPLAVGINIVLTCLIGVVLLGEAMSIGRVAGILFILCGVMIASLDR